MIRKQILNQVQDDTSFLPSVLSFQPPGRNPLSRDYLEADPENDPETDPETSSG
jgi:hypothetical protein